MTPKREDLKKKYESLTQYPLAKALLNWMKENGFDDIEPNFENQRVVDDLKLGRMRWREIYHPGLSFFVGFSQANRPRTDEVIGIFTLEIAIARLNDPVKPLVNGSELLRFHQFLNEQNNNFFPFRCLIEGEIVLFRFSGEMEQYQKEYLEFVLPHFFERAKKTFEEIQWQFDLRPFWDAQTSLEEHHRKSESA